MIDPQPEEKLHLVRLLDALGVSVVNISFPGAGPRAAADAAVLARAIADERLRIRPACAARTLASDITPIIEISQASGLRIEVMAFIGSSPVRQYAEGWDVAEVVRLSSTAIDLGVRHGLPVTYVNEDSVRSSPQSLEILFRTAIDHGAHRLPLRHRRTPRPAPGCRASSRSPATSSRAAAPASASTGTAITTAGWRSRTRWPPSSTAPIGCTAPRSASASESATRRSSTLLLNLRLGAATAGDLTRVTEFATAAARAFQVAVPFNYPLVGRDAFRTATGVHTAAILKAERKGHLARRPRVLGVPAGLFGRTQEIEISAPVGRGQRRVLAAPPRARPGRRPGERHPAARQGVAQHAVERRGRGRRAGPRGATTLTPAPGADDRRYVATHHDRSRHARLDAPGRH